MRKRKISEQNYMPNYPEALEYVQSNIGDRQKYKQLLALLLRMKVIYSNDPEKLKAIDQMIRDLKAPFRMSPGERKKVLGRPGTKDENPYYKMSPGERDKILGRPGTKDENPYYKMSPGERDKILSQESVNEAGLHSEEDIQKMQRFLAAVKANPTLKQQFASLTMEAPNPFDGGTNRPPKGAPNPFDGGTNRPPAPSGTPGKPRPGDAGLPQAERLREIQALGSMLQQSIEYSVEDLVKAVTAGDERAARNELGDLKRLFNEVIRAMADEAGIKAKLNPFGIKPPKPSQDKKVRPSNPTFKDIVTAPANEDIREASMIRRGKLKISEASEAAFVLAKNYSLPELNRMYKTKK